MKGTGALERRASPRRGRQECGWLVATRVRPGHDVLLRDLSGGGALVEGPVRLVPGAPVELQLVAVDGGHRLRGRVLRCSVCALDGTRGVQYRAALVFDQHFVPPDDDDAA